MFFRKKNREMILAQEFKELVNDSNQQIISLIKDGQEYRTRVNQRLEEGITHLQSAVNKHNMAVEDLLEEWEDKRSEEELASIKIKELEAMEEQFLKLFETYLDQFYDMKRIAGDKDSEWAKQLQFMEAQIEQYQQLCGIVVINSIGVKVDYDRYEVLETAETEDKDLDCKVAQIFRCGYLYKGSVRRKAQASVYRMDESCEYSSGADHLLMRRLQ